MTKRDCIGIWPWLALAFGAAVLVGIVLAVCIAYVQAAWVPP